MIPLRLPVFAGKRVHLGVTGSIAAYKGLDLLRLFVKTGLTAGATLTHAASRFVTDLSFASLGADPVYGDLFQDRLAPYGHLEPGQVAQAMVIAPATASMLAKLAHGLADDMLSTQALAFDGPLIIAPCMNPRMWRNPATRANWETLLSRGIIGVPPCSGDVACGDSGQGRLAETADIYLATLKALAPHDLTGQKILITLGPTREHFDKVRFWSNPSSGKMGWSLAMAAWLRHARVTVVHGPVNLTFPPGVDTIGVNTAREMFDACMDLWPDMDMGCCTAAVADFSPVPHGRGKLKKDECPEGLCVTFTRNPDILKTMGEHKRPDQRLIGFAAEAEVDLQTTAKAKLTAKNLDLIAANRIDSDETGFARWNNSVLLLDSQGQSEHMLNRPKIDIAWRIWDWM
ncbi:bifunctional phosphopantothenoylcysteine decarboxylase/phosphopantothenate--cysteine ligase CoaBC [Desulfoplanes formicivorans]|uniref:Coenzyme A biosynthesis bifunctional protein CoaBC n=1 Tax=Desulfoplanes formicivorans TaxID=1592317 RepID=A0A194AHH5_9BACT|nr:bifunctional phosphopantothenoylcysteine decarboxylase/phosphopantothenate--cysteine ligase CoaBC [Desulfoplanes formicivorans]GAU08783.1 phosphopantothenoylcysteine decarboxylase [Desulfoplanes formicivorans]